MHITFISYGTLCNHKERGLEKFQSPLFVRQINYALSAACSAFFLMTTKDFENNLRILGACGLI